MTINIPSAELTGVADAINRRVVPAAAEIAAGAAAAEGQTDGILQYPAASRTEAVAQKLGSAARLGDDATAGLVRGLHDVVTKFGRLDDKAGH